ncbi:hypothetical protein MVEN_00953300 [Mycena venus]|uniref:Uncharacterized protein n=1 Tax=Mycena venus TaxID=2733690 RepID=A0A8H6YC07_9AGAR|nr:hypothetical protein MVEN_00953300 [Mycena venus]
MGYARLPLLFRLPLVFLLIQIPSSCASPTPDYTFTLFGLPITVYTGDDDDEGDAITTLTSSVSTHVRTTTSRTSLEPTIDEQKPTTSATTPSKTAQTTTTTSSQKADTSHTSSSDESVSAASSITVATTVPTPLTDLSTTAEPVKVLSTTSFEAAASSPSESIAPVPSGSSRHALVANIFIPLVVFFLLLVAGIVYKRRRARAKKDAQMDIVPYMYERFSGAGGDSDAWNRFDMTNSEAAPPRLAVPSRILDIRAGASISPPPTIRYSVPRADDWHSVLAYLTTDDGHSFGSNSSYWPDEPTPDSHPTASSSSAPVEYDVRLPSPMVEPEQRNALSDPRNSHIAAHDRSSPSPARNSPVTAKSEKRSLALLSDPARNSHLLGYDRYSTPPPAYNPFPRNSQLP